MMYEHEDLLAGDSGKILLSPLNLNTDLSDSADSALSGESVFGIT